MSKELYFKIKVTAKAPQDYKPRTMTLTGLGVSNKANAKSLLEKQAIELYKKALTSANPGVEFNFSAVSENMNPQFVLVDNEEPGKAKKAKREIEQVTIEQNAVVENNTPEKAE